MNTLKHHVAILVMAVCSSAAQADRNPFVPPPAKMPEAMVEQGGLTREDVIMIFNEQRVMAEFQEGAMPGPELTGDGKIITEDDVLNQLVYVGEINQARIYKNNEEDCYVEQDVHTDEVAKSRCYESTLNRLRNAPDISAVDQSAERN
jgi:hypothetical protein